MYVNKSLCVCVKEKVTQWSTLIVLMIVSLALVEEEKKEEEDNRCSEISHFLPNAALNT